MTPTASVNLLMSRQNRHERQQHSAEVRANSVWLQSQLSRVVSVNVKVCQQHQHRRRCNSLISQSASVATFKLSSSTVSSQVVCNQVASNISMKFDVNVIVVSQRPLQRLIQVSSKVVCSTLVEVCNSNISIASDMLTSASKVNPLQRASCRGNTYRQVCLNQQHRVASH